MQQVMTALKTFVQAEESQDLRGYLEIVQREVERAIFCTKVHLPDLIKHLKIKGVAQEADDILLGVTKIPWFEVCTRLTAFIDHFVNLAEKQKAEH